MNNETVIREIYADAEVRLRIEEFIGLSEKEEADSLFLSTSVDPMNSDYLVKRPRELDFFLSRQLDIARSLWDRRGLIAHLDVEYVNYDFEAEPYLDPERAYALQEPIRQRIECLLAACGIRPLVCLSGRGCHYAWTIPCESNVYDRLVALNHVPEQLAQYYRYRKHFDGEVVDPKMAKAFAGLGKVMEYLVWEVKRQSDGRCPIPVLLSAVLVPPQQRGREMISLDITEYGDPLNTRTIRVPFSVYLKPWRQGYVNGPDFNGDYPLIFLVPMQDMDFRQAMQAMRDPQSILALARATRMTIPQQAQGTGNLLEAYRASPLFHFHEYFFSRQQEDPADWPRTYDLAPLHELPECIRYCLEHPNDLLLKPAVIRQVVLVLLGRGWHPRDIAGLIRSKYERDYGWGEQWYIYNAGMRADFYVRIFAGGIETGVDRLEDLTCVLKKDEPGLPCDGCKEVMRYRDLVLRQVQT